MPKNRGRIISGILFVLFISTQTAAAQSGSVETASPGGSKNVELRGTGMAIILNTNSNSLGLKFANTPDAAIDVSYFFVPQVAVQLFATYVKADVQMNSRGSLGSFGLLPPVLTVQYHILPGFWLQPYVGAGFNYNHFVEASGLLKSLDVSIKDSFGFVAEAGIDYKLPEMLYANINAKFLTTAPTVQIAADNASEELVTQGFMVGIGLGYRF